MRVSAIRSFLGITVLGVAFSVLTPAAASAQTANVAVNASVSRNCTIAASPVTFPAYDPVVANATAAATGQGNVQVACTKGVAPTIGLSLGSNAAGSTRRLANGAERLVYELFKDTSSTVWGASGGGVMTADPAPSRTARDFPVYGSIAGGQDVAAGSYTDTVVATVNF